MIDGAVYLAVPLEILAAGGEDLSAPAVVNVDAEVEVVDLVVVGLRDTEEVVQPSPSGLMALGSKISHSQGSMVKDASASQSP